MKRCAIILSVFLLGACSRQSPEANTPYQKQYGQTPYLQFFEGTPDATLEQQQIEEAIALGDASSLPHLKLIRDLGGYSQFSAFLRKNAQSPEVVQQKFSQYGLKYNAPNSKMLAPLNYRDCVKFFPTADRGQTFTIIEHLMNSSIDGEGRPFLSSKIFPAYGLKDRQPKCQAWIGNLFTDNSYIDWQGGHLIGYESGGYGGRANVVPQNSNFNGGRYQILEKTLRSCTNLWQPRIGGTGNVEQNVQVFYKLPQDIIPFGWQVSGKVWNQKKNPPVGFQFRYPFLNEFQGGPDGPLYVDNLKKAATSLGCGRKVVTFVIDDTGSMGSALNGATAAMADYVNTSPVDPDIEDYWNLVTFKDSSRNYGVTTSRETVLGQLGSLYPQGGWDCPEDVLGGVSSALGSFDSQPDFENVPKDLIVVTDASAQPGDVEGLIARAQATTSKVNVVLTGNCGLPTTASARLSASSLTMTAQELSSFTVLKRIADETGGTFTYIPGATFEDYRHVLLSLLNTVSGSAPADTEPPVVQTSATPSRIWPPNHKMVEIKVTVNATDNVDPNPTVQLIGVASSESDNGQGDGNTANDVQVTPTGQIFVRAERSGKAGQRVYTVTHRVSDQAGNETYATTDVVIGSK